MVGMVLLAWSAAVPPAAAQAEDADGSSLIERYRAARHRLLARRHLQRRGRIRVLPPRELPTPVDSLHPPDPRTADQGRLFPIRTVRRVRPGEREWFRTRFANAHWSFLGSTSSHAFLDTTRTRNLRARLQARFGDPTQTLGDAPRDGSWTDRPQFEYWFVVNDSIPVRVTDPRGPNGRGLIVSAKRRYRSQLRSLRDTLLGPLRHSMRAPYVDYYYETRRGHWYRTGFDGRDFFLRKIERTDLVPGRRARLDTTRASPTPSSSSAGPSSP